MSFFRGRRGAHKNAKSKARGIVRKMENIAKHQAIAAKWRALSPQEQLKRLPPGGAKKQRAKILARIAAKKVA